MTLQQAIALMADEGNPVWMRRPDWPEPYEGMGCFLWVPVDSPGDSPVWHDHLEYNATSEDQAATDWTPVVNYETGAIIPPPKKFMEAPFLRLRP